MPACLRASVHGCVSESVLSCLCVCVRAPLCDSGSRDGGGAHTDAELKRTGSEGGLWRSDQAKRKGRLDRQRSDRDGGD